MTRGYHDFTGDYVACGLIDFCAILSAFCFWQILFSSEAASNLMVVLRCLASDRVF